jgi:hypothetical protein
LQREERERKRDWCWWVGERDSALATPYTHNTTTTIHNSNSNNNTNNNGGNAGGTILATRRSGWYGTRHRALREEN